jgi:hypothetical protein
MAQNKLSLASMPDLEWKLGAGSWCVVKYRFEVFGDDNVQDISLAKISEPRARMTPSAAANGSKLARVSSWGLGVRRKIPKRIFLCGMAIDYAKPPIMPQDTIDKEIKKAPANWAQRLRIDHLEGYGP